MVVDEVKPFVIEFYEKAAQTTETYLGAEFEAGKSDQRSGGDDSKGKAGDVTILDAHSSLDSENIESVAVPIKSKKFTR